MVILFELILCLIALLVFLGVFTFLEDKWGKK